MADNKVEFLSAVLLISKNHDALAAFYRDVVGLPLEEEEHGETHKHYGCELGDLHFAIHPLENFAGQVPGVGSVKLAFTVFDLTALRTRVEKAGYKFAYEPKDTGFAMMTAIHDPDGNYIEFTQLSDHWFKHLERRKANGFDVVSRWKSLKAGAVTMGLGLLLSLSAQAAPAPTCVIKKVEFKLDAAAATECGALKIEDQYEMKTCSDAKGILMNSTGRSRYLFQYGGTTWTAREDKIDFTAKTNTSEILNIDEPSLKFYFSKHVTKMNGTGISHTDCEGSVESAP